MVFNNSILLGAGGQSGAATFDSTLIGNSIWFDGSADYLNRTPSSAGNRTRWTLAWWFQLNAVATDMTFFSANVGGNDFFIRMDGTSNQQITVQDDNASGSMKTVGVQRDIGWYHCIVSLDTNQAIATDRVRVYINGELQELTTHGTFGTFDSGGETFWNNNQANEIGRRSRTSSSYAKAYMAQILFLDGDSIQNGDVAVLDFLDTFTFGTNGSQFIPKKDSDIAALATTAGGNSFCLDFENSSDLGNDISSNNNDFTPTSMGSANHSGNTPSNSYPILNVLDPTTATASSGNLNFAGPSADNKAALRTTIGIPDNSGKFYFEYEMTGGSNDALMFGIAGDGSANDGYDDFVSDITPSIAVYTENGSNKLYVDGSVTTSSLFGSAPSSGDVIGVAYDSETRKVWFALNNTYAGSGNPAAGTGETATLSSSGTAFPTASARGSSDTLTLRFDSSDFTHSAPTGYSELNTANLTAPTYQGIDYFDATLYEGNGGVQRVGDFVPFTDAYTVTNSVMFDDGDSRSLSLNPSSSATSSTVAAISLWLKLGNLGTYGRPYTIRVDGNNYFGIAHDADDKLSFVINNGGATILNRTTTRIFKDKSAWHNLVVIINNDGSVAQADRVKIFYDGVQIPNDGDGFASSGGTCSLDGSSALNFLSDSSAVHDVGGGVFSQHYDGYVAEVVFLDGADSGSKLDATPFGQVDTSTNRWVAKDPGSYTFGNMGYYLEFKVAPGTGNGAGTDTSGRDNHFTSNGSWATSDQFTDCPSQNFDVLGGAQVGGTISEGNTKAALGTGGNQIRSNFNLSSGKWYVESDIQATNNSASIGLVPSRSATFSNGPGRDANGGISYETDGDVFSDNVQNATAEASFAAGDVVQMAIDMDAKKVYFGKNNTFGGDPAAGTGGHSLPASILSDGAALITLGNYSGSQSSTQQINYGQLLVFDGSSTTNGFKYTPPTGFKAVNQDNLDDTASKLTAWAWIKNRDAADNHMLFDRVRGVGKDLQLFSNSTVAQATDANTLQRFLQRGVQVGNDAKVNTANESFVLWQWLVGDSATTGTVIPADNPPSIASTVITADAGHFSVGTFTGAGGASTIGHGLSAAPEFFLVKRIGTSGTGWFIYSKDTTDPDNKFLRLQGANAEGSASGAWTPGATTMGLNESSLNGINTSGVEHLFIAFRSVPGVCKVGKYVGNGDGSSSSFDGPYISTGFKPKWLMVKWMQGGSLSGEGWLIKDTSRQVINPNDDADIYASSSTGENAGATHGADILADGFKLRGGGGANNKSGATYLYLAMADIGGNGTLPPIYGR